MRPVLRPFISALALITVLFPRQADACSLPQGGLTLAVPGLVPETGVLFMPVVCVYDCEDPSALTVTVMRDGEEIGGSIIASQSNPHAWVAWLPDLPFVQGVYSVAFEHPDKRPNEEPQAFEVTSDPVASAGELTVEPWSYARVLGPDACCVEGTIDSCGGASCYTIPEEVTSVINLTLDFGLSDTGLPGGFVYRARASGEPFGIWSASRSATVNFLGEASEYCYDIEARDLRTDMIEVIFSGCFEGSEVPAVDQDAELAGVNKWLFSQCSVPPAGYEARWCETFAENIRTGSCEGTYEAGCEAALAACPVSPTDPEGSGGSGGSPGGSGGAPSGAGGAISASGGSGAEGPDTDPADDPTVPSDPDDSSDSASDRNVRGCSYANPLPETNPSWLLAAAGIFWAIRARRREAILRATRARS